MSQIKQTYQESKYVLLNLDQVCGMPLQITLGVSVCLVFHVKIPMQVIFNNCVIVDCYANILIIIIDIRQPKIAHSTDHDSDLDVMANGLLSWVSTLEVYPQAINSSDAYWFISNTFATVTSGGLISSVVLLSSLIAS